ncbi:MAG: IclR family transcriptional regulator [Pseudomonadota bacterium]
MKEDIPIPCLVSEAADTMVPAGMAERHAARGTHTLERALTLLKAFDGYTGPVGNAELVRRTGFSKASVSRITNTLVALGYLDRASDCLRFQIGLRGLTLGHNYRANNPVKLLARPIMQAFADELDMSVALATGDGMDTLYLEYCKGRHIATLRMGVGSRMPIELTSIGRAYLWALPPQERERLLENIRQRPDKKQAAHSMMRIEQAFDHLDKYGYCVAMGEFQRDSYGISVPAYLGNPAIPMALNCGAILPAPSDDHIHNVLVPQLMQTADALASAMSRIDSILI